MSFVTKRQQCYDFQMNKKIAFISDLHLQESDKKSTSALLKFLDQYGQTLDQLYILGDMFELWVGDDEPQPWLDPIIKKFQQLRTQIYFMPGNRDFLVGQDFLNNINTTKLSDPCVIDVCGQPLIISHGDQLCTDDKAYQRYRRIINHTLTKKILLCLPITCRQKIAAKLRLKSTVANASKPTQIMDVNQEAVASLFSRFPQAHTLIHGHTHRPGCHEFEIEGATKTRLVLGAWHDHANAIIYSKMSKPSYIKL